MWFAQGDEQKTLTKSCLFWGNGPGTRALVAAAAVAVVVDASAWLGLIAACLHHLLAQASVTLVLFGPCRGHVSRASCPHQHEQSCLRCRFRLQVLAADI